MLLFGTHAVYLGSTGLIQLCDSAYTLVLGERLLKTGSFDLRPVVPIDPAARARMLGYVDGWNLPYQMRWYVDPDSGEMAATYGYPMGTVLLSLPWIKHDLDRGRSLIGADGAPDSAAEGEEQLRIATQVSAAIAVLFYLIARVYLPLVPAALLAVAFAFGSPVWSTMSRALWSHTWMAFWLSAAILLVSLRTTRPALGRFDAWLGVGLGTVMFLIFLSRPHGVISAAAIGLYLLFGYRKLLAVTVVTGLVWMSAWVAVCLHYFGKWQPPQIYAANLLDTRDMLERFSWVIASPSRGLLVYFPYLPVALAILFLLRKRLSGAGMLVPALVSIGGMLLVLACFRDWWAGYSYGQRYLADVLPWFVLVTAIAVRALLQAPRGWVSGASVAALAACFAFSIFVHYRGANSHDAWA